MNFEIIAFYSKYIEDILQIHIRLIQQGDDKSSRNLTKENRDKSDLLTCMYVDIIKCQNS